MQWPKRWRQRSSEWIGIQLPNTYISQSIVKSHITRLLFVTVFLLSLSKTTFYYLRAIHYTFDWFTVLYSLLLSVIVSFKKDTKTISRQCMTPFTDMHIMTLRCHKVVQTVIANSIINKVTDDRKVFNIKYQKLNTYFFLNKRICHTFE